jgi:hypothetical protein
MNNSQKTAVLTNLVKIHNSDYSGGRRHKLTKHANFALLFDFVRGFVMNFVRPYLYTRYRISALSYKITNYFYVVKAVEFTWGLRGKKGGIYRDEVANCKSFVISKALPLQNHRKSPKNADFGTFRVLALRVSLYHTMNYRIINVDPKKHYGRLWIK